MLRVFIVALLAAVAAAQQMPPSPVGYTEARQYPVQGSVQLPGTIESNLVSLVASEIGGLVVEYPIREGDRVKKDQVLARLNKHALELNLAAARAQLSEAEARQKLAERNYERARELYDSKVFSQQQLDDTRFEFDAWQGRIDNLKAEIQRIEYDIERSAILAPFDGVIIAKHTEVGQWLGIGDEVAELMSLDELEVVVDVPEQYYRTVRVGGSAQVTLDAQPGRTIRGRISAVIPRADEQARTFPVKVRVPSDSGRLGAGMLAQVRMDGVSASQAGTRLATIVPKDAVVRQGTEELVYLLDGDGTVKPAQVKTGNGVGAWIEVAGSVQPGAKVVTRGNERLQPGQKVRGEPVKYTLP